MRVQKACRVGVWIFGTVAALFVGKAVAAPCQFKGGVLFPEGTIWMKKIHKMVEEIEEKTNGECTFTIYTGGTQGDEPTMLQKMRLGQLNMGFFSGMALSKIDRAIEVLEVPATYNAIPDWEVGYREADYVHEKILPTFQKRFRAKGYELIAIASQGYMFVFTTKKVETFDDIKKLKFELWSGLLLNQKLCDGFHLNCIPVSFPEILTNLQTGLLEAVFLSPAALVGLQWHTELHYALDMPLTHGIGGLIVTKRMWDKIPPAHQAVIRETVHKYLLQVHEASRRDDKLVWDAFPEQGLEIIHPSDEMVQDFIQQSHEMREQFVGDLYPKEILDEVKESLKEFREKGGVPAGGQDAKN